MKLFRAYLKQLGSARVRVDHVNRLPVPKSSGHRDSAVIVAVPFIRMMHVAFDDVVGMTAVRYRLMSTTSPMIVLTVVRTASMSRRTSGRIRATLRQGMFIHMPLVSCEDAPHADSRHDLRVSPRCARSPDRGYGNAGRAFCGRSFH